MNSMPNASQPLQQEEYGHPPTTQVYNSTWDKAQCPKPDDQSKLYRSQLVIIITITIITIIGMIMMMINSLNILHIYWIGVIEAMFSAISVLLAIWPISLKGAKKGNIQEKDATTLPHDTQRKIFLWNRKKRGVLHVKVGKHLRHTTLTLYPGFNQEYCQSGAATSISEQLINGEIAYVGTFPSVETGNYTVTTQNKEHITFVTIYPGTPAWVVLQ